MHGRIPGSRSPDEARHWGLEPQTQGPGKTRPLPSRSTSKSEHYPHFYSSRDATRACWKTLAVSSEKSDLEVKVQHATPRLVSTRALQLRPVFPSLMYHYAPVISVMPQRPGKGDVVDLQISGITRSCFVLLSCTSTFLLSSDMLNSACLAVVL